MKLSIVALLMMVAAILEPSVSNPMPQSAGHSYQRNNTQSAAYPHQSNCPRSCAHAEPGIIPESAVYLIPGNDPRATDGNNPYAPHPQYPPTPVHQDGRQGNMAPSSGPPIMSAGTFTGKQSGSALSQGETITDSRTQGTRSRMQGGMVGSGKLQGTVKTKSSNGNNAQSGYTGELQGKGLMSSDTVAYSDGRGAGSRTAVKGQLSGEGTISGGSAGGATGGYNDAFWKKK